jgi:hypothetical protein
VIARRVRRFSKIGRARPPGAPSWSLALTLMLLPASVLAAQIIPTAPGMAWRYNMTQEVDHGISVPDARPDSDGKIRASVVYRIEGTQNVDGKELLKFEMHRAGVITNTDLLTVDEHGMLCWARINLDGELVKFNPPQPMIAMPLKRGARWNFDGQAGDLKVHQHYEVTGEEDVQVPAGKFHAFRIRSEQTSPSPMTIDRWFAAGTGIVKDVTTMRATSGDLLERISLELAEAPRVTDRPEAKPEAAPKKLSVSFAKDEFGKASTTFSSDTPQIYARWQGQRLRRGATVRAVWIAENIGEDVPPDYKADEASAIAESPTAHGAFTLSQPEDGWAIGDYRAEFYVDDVLVETVKIKIMK